MTNVIEHPTRHTTPRWIIEATGDVANLVRDEVSQMKTVDELTDLGSHPPGGPKNGVKVIAALAGRPESEVTEQQACDVWFDSVLLAGQALIDGAPAAGDEAGCRGDADPVYKAIGSDGQCLRNDFSHWTKPVSENILCS